MGRWYMSLSDYMGGGCLWKFNSIGGGVKKKSVFFPLQVFFSGVALRVRNQKSIFLFLNQNICCGYSK